MKKSFTTRSLNVPFPRVDAHKALDMPVYETVAYEFDSSEDMSANFRGELPAHVYSRTSNPTVEYFEQKIKALTGAYQVLAVASGMAAISNTILSVCKSGDNIISGNHLFAHSYALLDQSLRSYGLEPRFVDTTDEQAVEKLIDENTRAIYFETVTNPQLEIADISKLSAIAKKYNLLLIADSTVTPPLIFNGRFHGIDIEVMSTTKHISGGGTSFGGLILDHGSYNWALNPNLNPLAEKFGKDTFIARLRKNYFRNTGGAMSAHTAHYQILGLDLLELRFERSYASCIKLGEFLSQHPKVCRVTYPGLKGSHDYDLAASQFNGKPGTILTFELKSEAACFTFMNHLHIIRRATNLNDNKSLIIHPWSTIFVEFSEDERRAMRIQPTALRLSVGIEAANDLIQDLELALNSLD
ncbi:aminotransferase class I/II-fold pyridoxal phosphate-dependent enzyme [Sunxiuqinia sp. sy24]|uniref:aminotransferase class I/II-fold pyridoxal phosphate-dependent enzyme n=1 Tax=Sunxiuqinia sp. sy24 TaxID=3461495 RepID=UPI0040460B05